MNILVVGTGYVGLVTGACLAELGLKVTCLDVDKAKIDNIKRGVLPIYEPGLESVVSRNVNAKRLSFTNSYDSITNNDVIFLAVGTPPQEDGSADLQYVLAASKAIAEKINKYTVIVNKSTVPVGTGQKVKSVITDVLNKRKVPIDFDIVSNPEFLREGVAVNDFMKPDRIVIGYESERAKEYMKMVYTMPYNNNQVFVFTNIETAEMIKYASNAFLATKISFINEISTICEKVGADVKDVALGMGLDHRINKYSLYAGAGYGGSCFPKDTKALINIAGSVGVETKIIKAAEEVNTDQKHRMVTKIENALGTVKNKTIGILGLSFKPETDDVREAPAIVIIKELKKKGAIIKAFDPIAIDNIRKYALIDQDIYYAKDEYDLAAKCDALVFITEWAQFRTLDLQVIGDLMKGEYLFDLRNMFDPRIVEEKQLRYIGVGR